MYDIWHLRGAINTGDTCAHHHCRVFPFPYLNCYYSCCHSHSHSHHHHHHPCHHFSDVKVEYAAVLLVVACKDEKKKAQRIRMSCKAINFFSIFFPHLEIYHCKNLESDSVNKFNNLCYLYQEPSIAFYMELKGQWKFRFTRPVDLQVASFYLVAHQSYSSLEKLASFWIVKRSEERKFVHMFRKELI